MLNSGWRGSAIGDLELRSDRFESGGIGWSCLKANLNSVLYGTVTRGYIWIRLRFSLKVTRDSIGDMDSVHGRLESGGGLRFRVTKHFRLIVRCVRWSPPPLRHTETTCWAFLPASDWWRVRLATKLQLMDSSVIFVVYRASYDGIFCYDGGTRSTRVPCVLPTAEKGGGQPWVCNTHDTRVERVASSFQKNSGVATLMVQPRFCTDSKRRMSYDVPVIKLA